MIDLFSDKDRIELCATAGKHEKDDDYFYIRLLSVDKKTSIRRKMHMNAAIDLAKYIYDAFPYRCPNCKKRWSIEKGEYHHGCLSCDGENELCRACSGSGEGYYTTNDKCTACDGSGIVVEKEGAE